ncbi:MAG: ATP-binding protein [Acidobacteriota bacterium]|nr:ATP-binding protein [Acidobacteriota bacterium]MDQ2841117.1 ATP-binding protein [Acidobacteriota bacterium]
MIKLEAAHIEEVRGIRKLDIDFQKGTFSISGPNGSGKSGVIDAIEFGLTGQISRLTGRGTKGLTVSEHGPHVDKTKFPDAAFVELKVFLPDINISATITRKISAPKKPKIVPADADVLAAFAEIADHPEIALSRREILRFILVEPTKRSEEIQTILKLDEIGDTRSAFNTAQNKLQTAHQTSAATLKASRQSLILHLQIPTLRAEDLLEAVNKCRKLLALSEIAELSADTTLDTGLSSASKVNDFNKQSSLRDVGALAEAEKGFSHLAKAEATAIISDLARLEGDPALLAALQRRSFIEKGLDLVEGPDCPLCDRPWENEQHLRDYLKAKLAKSEEARKLQEALLKNGTAITREAVRVMGLVGPVQKIADGQGQSGFSQTLTGWKTDLEGLRPKLTTVDGLTGLKDRLSAGWPETPKALSKDLQSLTEKITANPAQTTALDAQTFLTTAQLRLTDYREAMRKNKAAEIAAVIAKTAYGGYCVVLEEELNNLYEEVQKDFSAFYRAVNEDDEDEFTAKLTPTAGSLGLDVNFYDRGLFPPAAFHSEGHQDGMGVCLYLALMKRLFGKRFTFALLDDLVMSVDAGQRYQFCKLLKTQFPDTQFVITTHDRLWAEQMESAGLVSGKMSLSFHSWTIDTGPLVESNVEIWQEIATALGKGKVEAAAAALRHHLEYVARHLADQLGATPQFRADGNYELGELMPSVLKRMKDVCGKAAEAAQSWGKSVEREVATTRKTALSTSNAALNVEQWAVNKAVHYNAWANFGKKDFEPVVTAYKELLACFSCPSCDSWLYAAPRLNPESLRCACNAVSLNLKVREK